MIFSWVYYLLLKTIFREPSAGEKKALALVSNKEEEAKRLLAQCYGVLVLGLGLEDGHHMKCGR